MSSTHIKSDETLAQIHDLIAQCGADPTAFSSKLVTEMIQTSLKLLFEGHDDGQVKLINRALKEIRYGYLIFNDYPHARRITIFGSARTPPEHPDYQRAKALAAALSSEGWMAITGAADGIMKAGHEGSQREGSFGLSIFLPAEKTSNSIIQGDPKLINFRYFFTRKLMFLSHSDAVAVFPGGFGTQDELFECLTLMQTGKSNIIPVVLLEGEEGTYWPSWKSYIEEEFLARGTISPEDEHFFYLAPDIPSAIEHIETFYRNFHSYRYVRDVLVLRVRAPLSAQQIEGLNEEFGELVADGKIEQGGPLKEETDHLDLPRVAFVHTRRNYGLVRALIDRINSLEL